MFDTIGVHRGGKNLRIWLSISPMHHQAGRFYDVILAKLGRRGRPMFIGLPDHCEFPMRILILASILAFSAGQAHADVAQDALAGIVKCADIPDPSRRLECFDAATARAKDALAAPAQPVKEKGGIMDWFGFSKPRPVVRAEDFGKTAPVPGPAEVTQISATVLEFAKTARGRAIFILENGQVWRQLDSDGTDVLPPPQSTTMKVTIETGAFGSYNLTIAGRNGLVKVSRLK